MKQYKRVESGDSHVVLINLSIFRMQRSSRKFIICRSTGPLLGLDTMDLGICYCNRRFRCKWLVDNFLRNAALVGA